MSSPYTQDTTPIKDDEVLMPQTDQYSQRLILIRKQSSHSAVGSFSQLFCDEKMSSQGLDNNSTSPFSPAPLLVKRMSAKRLFKDTVEKLDDDELFQYSRSSIKRSEKSFIEMIEEKSDKMSEEQIQDFNPFERSNSSQIDMTKREEEDDTKRRNAKGKFKALQFEYQSEAYCTAPLLKSQTSPFLGGQSMVRKYSTLQTIVEAPIRPLQVDCSLYSETSEAQILRNEMAKCRKTGLNTISHDVMANLINQNENPIVVIDCRFGYEYDGGHIKGALNLNTRESMEEYFFTNKVQVEELMRSHSIIIFHCEFSQLRGPTMFKALRQTDRKLHEHFGDQIFYNEVYLLQGGFSEFYEKYPELCQGQYVPMKDDNFKLECKEQFKDIQNQKHRKITASVINDAWENFQIASQFESDIFSNL